MSPLELKKRIKARMAWLRVNQRELAAGIGVNESAVSRFLSTAGKPRAKTVERVAVALGMRREDLESEDVVCLVTKHPAFEDNHDRVRVIRDLIYEWEQGRGGDR